METCKHGSGAGSRKPTAEMRQGTECRAYQDIEKVDSLRKEIGLEPLSEYMKDCGLKTGWSKEFYKNNIKLHESIFNSWFQSFKRNKNSY